MGTTAVQKQFVALSSFVPVDMSTQHYGYMSQLCCPQVLKRKWANACPLAGAAWQQLKHDTLFVG